MQKIKNAFITLVFFGAMLSTVAGVMILNVMHYVN
jgi:hypothetical protein